MLEKFLTKDNLIIVVVAVIMAFGFFVETKYFATSMELLALKNEVLQMKLDLISYSDQGDKEIMDKLDAKYEKILQKLDGLKK